MRLRGALEQVGSNCVGLEREQVEETRIRVRFFPRLQRGTAGRRSGTCGSIFGPVSQPSSRSCSADAAGRRGERRESSGTSSDRGGHGRGGDRCTSEGRRSRCRSRREGAQHHLSFFPSRSIHCPARAEPHVEHHTDMYYTTEE